MLSSLRNELRVTEPLGYLDMVELERAAAVIATDSGGVQKEAFFHGTPCVTLRSETEWVELIEAKWNRLAPPESADIVFETIVGTLGTKGRPIQPYGDGTAARRIVQELQRCFESSPNATGGN
jgi:UDP-GlcNAc3NAcA epimerase